MHSPQIVTYALVGIRMEHKGEQKESFGRNIGVTAVGKKAHLGMKQC